MTLTDWFEAQLLQVLKSLGIALLFALPLVIIGYVAYRRRKRYREQALEPFTDMPLRPPGESLRLKMEQLSEDIDASLAMACAIGTGATILVLLAPAAGRGQAWIIAGIIALVAYGHAGRKILGLQRALWDYRLGFTGERVVGEELNQLLADGFKVFHDLPFDGFNMDHVIVGPPGVYVVETKTRSKPADLKGTAKATVIYDGAQLQFPRHTETEPIDQARLNAKTLSKWLTSATGERTPVNAIVALPGWWVARKSKSDVNVLNPKEIAGSFPSKPAEQLPPDRIQRIVHQLTELCRLEKTP